MSNPIDKTFSYLLEIPNEQAQHLFELLQNLNHESSNELTNELLDTINSSPFASNASTVFQLYFPLASQILYFEPALASRLVPHLIEPLFVFGDYTVDLIVKRIQSSMNFTLRKNPIS